MSETDRERIAAIRRDLQDRGMCPHRAEIDGLCSECVTFLFNLASRHVAAVPPHVSGVQADPLCRCEPGVCQLHPTLTTCGMRDRPRVSSTVAELRAALERVTADMDRAGGDGYGMPECPWCRSQRQDNEHAGDCELLKARATLARTEGR